MNTKITSVSDQLVDAIGSTPVLTYEGVLGKALWFIDYVVLQAADAPRKLDSWFDYGTIKVSILWDAKQGIRIGLEN